MKMTISSVALAAVLGAMPAIAFAQATTVFQGADAAGDQVDDIADAVEDDFERSTDRGTFGNEGRGIGWYGSVSATGTATSGNTDTANVGIGTKFGYFDGVNGHDIALSYTYGEADGDTDANSLLASYDYTRNIATRTFAFGELSLAYDEFSSYESDVFVGGGVGYRVIDDGSRVWEIQGGPGYRFLEDANGVETDEAAFKVSSKFYQELNAGLFLTNDTDVLYSDTNTLITNDLGFNVAMSDGLALRTSLLTEYNTDPLPGLDDTDNTLGVSVVYNFN